MSCWQEWAVVVVVIGVHALVVVVVQCWWLDMVVVVIGVCILVVEVVEVVEVQCW